MKLTLKNVSHNYRDVEVLRDVSIEFESGHITCIVGPSGCGKSTLLRLLGGLEMPSAGDVLKSGAPSADCLNPMTYVFQDFALLPWRSVEGNIHLVLEDHRLPKIKASSIVEDVLNRTGLWDFKRALPRQLSGGMKQRVAIARALAVRPSVMLMDEPLSALDSQSRELLIDDFTRLWSASPFTAIYVTHNLNEAVRLGHKVIVLSRRPGRIRKVVALETPLKEREEDSRDMVECQKHLWNLMREEARAADEELVDG